MKFSNEIAAMIALAHADAKRRVAGSSTKMLMNAARWARV
jgi:hypothetical protein